MTLLQGTDDFLLRGIPRLDRLCGRLGHRRRIEAARPGAEPGAPGPRLADRAGDADLQRGSDAHHGGAAGHGRGARGASARIAASRSWCSRIRPTPMRGFAKPLRVDALRKSLAQHHAGLVSAALAEHRPQIRQSRGLRHALGRPLRSHDRARRRQPDRRADAAAAGADDAGRSGARDPADRAATHRRDALFSAACSSSPPASTVRSSRADWPPGPATAATTGATTPSSASPAFAAELRPAEAQGPQALRRLRAVA